MKGFALHTILAEIWRVVGDANRYFAAEEPWTKKKTDPERMGTILYVTAQVLRDRRDPGAALHAAGELSELLDLLAVAPEHRDFALRAAGRQGRAGTRAA